eukprot:3726683-Amphidinium_carterae.3
MLLAVYRLRTTKQITSRLAASAHTLHHDAHTLHHEPAALRYQHDRETSPNVGQLRQQLPRAPDSASLVGKLGREECGIAMYASNTLDESITALALLYTHAQRTVLSKSRDDRMKACTCRHGIPADLGRSFAIRVKSFRVRSLSAVTETTQNLALLLGCGARVRTTVGASRTRGDILHLGKNNLDLFGNSMHKRIGTNILVA